MTDGSEHLWPGKHGDSGSVGLSFQHIGHLPKVAALLPLVVWLESVHLCFFAGVAKPVSQQAVCGGRRSKEDQRVSLAKKLRNL